MGALTEQLFTALGRFMPAVQAPPNSAATLAEVDHVRTLNARAVADRDALIAQLPRGIADELVRERAQLLRTVNDPAQRDAQGTARRRINAIDHELVAQLERHVDRNIMDKADQHPYIAVLKYADDGMIRMWREHAAQYRSEAGLVEGWKTTAKMYAAMGATLLRTQTAKASHDRLRPYQTDARIQQLGHLSIDTSYPSGHTANAFAAAGVLSDGWQRLAAKRAESKDALGTKRALQQARDAERDALAIGMSRIAAGMHHDSDIQLGMLMGTAGASRSTGAPIRSAPQLT